MNSRVSNYDAPADGPQGFILNDAGMYSFVCQDIYSDILSFIYAIPDHLKPLFLIPIRIEAPANHYGSDGMVHISSRIARSHIADISPSGDTPEGDLFSGRTFVYDDLQPTVAPSDPGSIFDIDGADEKTHTQDLADNQDINVQSDADTSFLSDVDPSESYLNYPYLTPERPLRHSSEISIIVPRKIRYALKPQELETRTPDKIVDNAGSCSVSLLSYDKRSKIFSFTVNCGNGRHTVKAKINDMQHIALNCSCPFWRWNGPEYHASQNDYLLGAPAGKASPPDVRDSDRQFHLCKHAYSVVARIDNFVEELEDENWGMEDEDILEEVDKGWDRMEGAAEVDLDSINTEEIEAQVESEPDAELESYEDSDEVTEEIESPEETPEAEEVEEADEEDSEDEEPAEADEAEDFEPEEEVPSDEGADDWEEPVDEVEDEEEPKK